MTESAPTPFDEARDRLRSILGERLQRGRIGHAYELELAELLDIPIPAKAIERVRFYIEDCLTPAGYLEADLDDGDWLAIERQEYRIERTHDLVAIVVRGGLSVPNADRLTAWVRTLQTTAGDFAAQAVFEDIVAERHPGLPAELRAKWRLPLPHAALLDAYHALSTLSLLGAEPAQPAAAIEWVRAQQQADGSFQGPQVSRSALPFASRLEQTHRALASLALLRARPRDAANCRRFLLQATPKGGVLDVLSGYHRLEAMALLGARVPQAEAARLRERLHGELRVPTSASGAVAFETYATMRSLALLDDPPGPRG